MKNENDNAYSKFNDPVWYCLIEYPLNNLIADIDIQDEPETRMLIQTIIDLGVRPELLNNIVRKLIKVARGMTSQGNQNPSDSQLFLRLHCQGMKRRDVYASKPSSWVAAKSVNKSAQIVHSEDHQINRGWDYLMVARGGRARRDSTVNSTNWIDMYLYRQGE